MGMQTDGGVDALLRLGQGDRALAVIKRGALNQKGADAFPAGGGKNSFGGVVAIKMQVGIKPRC